MGARDQASALTPWGRARIQGMNIRCTEYTREDGVQAIRNRQDRWIIRRTDGICWFFDHIQNDWVPAHTVTRDNMCHFELRTMDEMMFVLTTVPVTQGQTR